MHGSGFRHVQGVQTDMKVSPAAMKSMKLYDQIERIHNELHALGIDRESPLAPEDLTPFDQFHYHGTAAVDEAVAELGLDSYSRVLEVGSGIGGPARHVTERAGCHVTALELQPDLSETAEELTGRCGLAKNIDHVCGDILDGGMAGRDFDSLISFLVFLHIPDRMDLFGACLNALKPGGRIYIEDLTRNAEPSEAEWEDLRGKIMCPYLPTHEDYVSQLREAGFENIHAQDMSASWTAFTAERYQAFLVRRPLSVELHGEEVTGGLEEFYRIACNLFDRQVFGGIRVWGTKP